MNTIPLQAVVVVLACLTLSGFASAESPFQIRGTIPWHNFLSGPTAWNESDYRDYLDDLASKKLNFIGFHCYTGGPERYVTYVEPIIRMKYRDVLPEATFDTSLTARWGYRPLAVRDFAFGTDKLFKLPEGAQAFGADAAITARSNEERYKNAHDLMRSVLTMAHQRGIQVGIGFEFGIYPPELMSIVPPDSRIGGVLMPDPTHPANIEILHNTLDDIITEYPGVDWVWLWLSEHSLFFPNPQLSGSFKELYEKEKANFPDAKSPRDVFVGVWSLEYIRQAHDYLARKSPKTKLIIGGWGGGDQFAPIMLGLDRALPKEIVFSCLNPGQGDQPHLPVMAQIASHRPVWAIPWLEGDSALWRLQPRVGSMINQVKSAARDGLVGVVACHWRTEEIRDNFEAFATTAADPTNAPSVESLYERQCRTRYGDEAAGAIAPLMVAMEREGWLAGWSSPEYYAYDPRQWGHIAPEKAQKVRDAIATIEHARDRATIDPQRSNLEWLADNLRFVLLLDQVNRCIAPARQLKDDWHRGKTGDVESARQEFRKAPIEELFRTYARRVRSRGELGELSSLNQKLWLEYRELDQFLKEIANHP
jgi:hypothetical protein